jgi:hypothetical protein
MRRPWPFRKPVLPEVTAPAAAVADAKRRLAEIEAHIGQHVATLTDVGLRNIRAEAYKLLHVLINHGSITIEDEIKTLIIALGTKRWG